MEVWRRASRVCGEPRHAKICGACETAAGGIMRLMDDNCCPISTGYYVEEWSHVTALGLHRRG